MANAAFQDGHRVLYHWQALNDDWLAKSLSEQVVYCSKPGDFNDPWDCKPFFNTDILLDPTENEHHIAWAADICRRHTGMSGQDIEDMKASLRNDPARAAALIRDITEASVTVIDQRYRVYCLGPDVKNLLMWSHYGDRHRGVCLELSLRNTVMCGALRCEYLDVFPIMKLHGQSDEENLQVLLAKAKPWSYENEYRIVAQERLHAIGDDTLLTDDGYLKLPQEALMSVIVGCQGNYGTVKALVDKYAPGVRVKRAVRMQNQYAIRIDD